MKGVKFRRSHKGKKFNYGIVYLLVAVILVICFCFCFYLFLNYSVCESEECFRNALVNCNSVKWLREGNDVDWHYKIKNDFWGKEGYCKVEVSLVQMKKGSIELESLNGESMTCYILKGESEKFPEEDISKCSGRLKEEIQDLVIKRMHNYLLENIGDIKNEFAGL